MAERDHFVHHIVDLYFLPAILSLPGKVITMAAMIALVAFSVLGYINLEQGHTIYYSFVRTTFFGVEYMSVLERARVGLF